jgi:hypothetical protein
MYIFKNFPGEKPPDPRPKGRPRLTRGGMGDGGEGKGEGWESPQNLYAAYAHEKMVLGVRAETPNNRAGSAKPHTCQLWGLGSVVSCRQGSGTPAETLFMHFSVEN